MPKLDAVFVGDMQSRLFVEGLIGREDNRAARARLRRELPLLDVAQVVFLGDLVSRQSAANWRDVDVLLAHLRAREMRLAAAVGNHDLWFCPSRGYAALAARGLIPARTTWRQVDAGNVRVMILDSNRGALGRARWDDQTRWLRKAIEAAEGDASVRAVVVASHHPPWTNSAVSGDHATLLAPLLRLFHESAKARVWLSGHVHAYERFESSGKALLVSGSAGAPRVALRTGSRARHVNHANVSAPSPFGWLELSAGEHEARLTLRGFTGEEPTAIRDELAF